MFLRFAHSLVVMSHFGRQGIRPKCELEETLR